MKTREQCVYIVDDDSAVRDSLGLLLGLNGFRTLPFSNADDFLKVCTPEWTGCLLLDIRMPGTDGLALQTILRERHIALPIIFMTAHGDVPTVRSALKAGAVDYLEKPVDPDSMLEAVRQAMDVDDAQRQKMARAGQSEQRLSSLTPREREVLELVVQGQQYRQIAAALGISPRTVEVHRARLMEKLGARNISELVRMSLSD
ncbi:MAG: DNA-binding response regulator [Betaproteobacteria bacterium]|jgi:RNA polymerase sigma factor (sigma-70 family)|nr:DNA-binding response regulator [Betaproteobacteria bacterium]